MRLWTRLYGIIYIWFYIVIFIPNAWQGDMGSIKSLLVIVNQWYNSIQFVRLVSIATGAMMMPHSDTPSDGH